MSALEAHFFKKSPYGDPQLQIDRNKKIDSPLVKQSRTIQGRALPLKVGHVCTFLCQIVALTRLPIKRL